MTEITILSGKGGTGKTSLSAVFATISTNMIIADCDVDAANLHLILQPQNYKTEHFVTAYKAKVDTTTCTNCGMCIEYCRFDAIEMKANKIVINQTTCDGCKLCTRICPSHSILMEADNRSQWFLGDYRNGKIAHARLAPGEENSGKLVNIVRQNARILAEQMGCQTIIIDGPPGTGCPVISSVSGVQKVIIVTEPSNSGFHDMKRLIELLSNFKVKPYLVINKYDLNEDFTNEIINWSIQNKITYAGKIAFDREFVDAMLQCKSIIEWAPNSETSQSIQKIYNKVIED